MTDLGMDLVREVERGRAGRKIDDVPAWSEGVDPLGFELPAERGQRRPGVLRFSFRLQELSQPGDARVEPRFRTLRALLVPPVGRDPELGLTVHLAGADLNLERPAARPHDRGVQRPVAVRLGVGDVVVELAGNVRPEPVHCTEHAVAFRHGIHEHANRPQVEELLDAGLLDAQGLALHLSPDTVDVLRATGHLGVDACLPELACDPAHDIVDIAFAVDAPFVELGGNRLVGGGIGFPEREVLDFPLVLPDAEAARERGVELQPLAGETLPDRTWTAARGPQPVKGQGELHDQDSHVVDNGEQQPAQPVCPSVFDPDGAASSA